MAQELAIAYLEQRAEQVSQSTLNQERQALQVMMQLVTHKLGTGRTPACGAIGEADRRAIEGLHPGTDRPGSGCPKRAKRRRSPEIAHAAGLRASELL